MIRLLIDELLECAESTGQSVVTAESCSAGLLALAFSRGKGASKHFMGGFVTYTKEMKSRVLKVPPQLLHDKTAVCSEVAIAMAKGALILSNASVAVSITGVAGPENDEDGNPVGLVYCAVARKDGGEKVIRLQCQPGKPEAVLDEACVEALKLLRSFCFS